MEVLLLLLLLLLPLLEKAAVEDDADVAEVELSVLQVVVVVPVVIVVDAFIRSAVDRSKLTSRVPRPVGGWKVVGEYCPNSASADDWLSWLVRLVYPSCVCCSSHPRSRSREFFSECDECSFFNIGLTVLRVLYLLILPWWPWAWLWNVVAMACCCCAEFEVVTRATSVRAKQAVRFRADGQPDQRDSDSKEKKSDAGRCTRWAACSLSLPCKTGYSLSLLSFPAISEEIRTRRVTDVSTAPGDAFAQRRSGKWGNSQNKNRGTSPPACRERDGSKYESQTRLEAWVEERGMVNALPDRPCGIGGMRLFPVRGPE